MTTRGGVTRGLRALSRLCTRSNIARLDDGRHVGEDVLRIGLDADRLRASTRLKRIRPA